eukprot:579062-Amphidinium_carterae.3
MSRVRGVRGYRRLASNRSGPAVVDIPLTPFSEPKFFSNSFECTGHKHGDILAATADIKFFLPVSRRSSTKTPMSPCSNEGLTLIGMSGSVRIGLSIRSIFLMIIHSDEWVTVWSSWYISPSKGIQIVVKALNCLVLLPRELGTLSRHTALDVETSLIVNTPLQGSSGYSHSRVGHLCFRLSRSVRVIDEIASESINVSTSFCVHLLGLHPLIPWVTA